MQAPLCRDCVSGTLSTDSPTGTEDTIHGLNTYVARPEGSATGLVVIITDAFGWDLPNNRVLAHRFAKKGQLLVYVPDFMNGHACSNSSLLLIEKITEPADWLTTILYKPFYILQAIGSFVPFMFFNRLSVAKPRVFNFFKALRTSPDTANMKIGAAGYCWGGKHAVLLSHDTPSSRVHRAGSEAGELQSLVDCAFTAHPSLLEVPKDIENVNKPLSIAIGDVDMAMKVDLVEQAKEILEKKKAGDHEVIIYPGAKHGFAIRGNPKDPVQKELGDKAEAQALAWWSTWLG